MGRACLRHSLIACFHSGIFFFFNRFLPEAILLREDFRKESFKEPTVFSVALPESHWGFLTVSTLHHASLESEQLTQSICTEGLLCRFYRFYR